MTVINAKVTKIVLDGVEFVPDRLRTGAGRPSGTKKSDSRTERVYVRLHPQEKEQLKKRAAAARCSVSEYLLVKALEGK